MKPEPAPYRGLTLSIYSGAFVFGLVMSSLGAILPELFQRVGFDRSDAGGLFLGMNFAMLLGSLAFGPICDRFGYRTLLLVSCLFVALAFFELSRAGDYGVVLTALALLGLGGGALNGATNSLVNDISPENRERALNLLGIFFGLGAFVVPFTVGASLARWGIQGILFLIILLALAAFVLFLCASFPRPKHESGFSWGECVHALRNPLLFLFAAILFLQSGNEFAVAGWTSTYLAERFEMTSRDAAYALSGYWAALLIARMAVFRLSRRIAATTLVSASAIVGFTGLAGMILSFGGAAATASVVIVGLGFAAIFPTVLAQAGNAFSSFSATAFSLLFVAALSGGMTTPWLVGLLAQRQSLGTALQICLVWCLGIAILQQAVRRRSRLSGPRSETP